MTGAPRRILLVEDSPTQAARFRSMLEREGMAVTHVASAEEALDRFESARPELVLLDYHLPGMNGDEFCREIRLNVNTRAIPVLMLTVETGDAAEARGLESGADDYLEKSADPDVLVARVRGLLRKSEGAAPILGADHVFSRPRVLIVSASPSFAESVARELGGENYELQRAPCEDDIAENLRGRVDCVLIDCGAAAVGAGEGRERVAAVRARAGPSPALLLLADRESKQQMISWLEAGADDSVARSVDPALLRARVRALLRRKALLDENRRIAEELAEKQLQAVRARAEREAAELRATMADRLEAANRELESANRKLREALEVTKAITDNAAEALFLLDREGRIDFVSPAASRTFGYSAEELIRRPFHDTLHHHRPDGRAFPAPECPAMAALLNGVAFACHDDVFFRKDGAPVDVAYSMSPIAAGGEVAGAVAVVQDVSERKRAEERLRRAQELERIGMLAGGIAHDFNNLLVGVIGNASLAADLLPEGHAAVELLQGVLRSGETAAHLTRQLLAYAGKGRFVVEPVDLSAIAKNTRLLLERTISKKIGFFMRLGENLPAVESDPSQMQQVLLNLVLNAAEAIGDNPGVIAVTSGSAELAEERTTRDLSHWPVEPGLHVFVEVRDTGCGMDAGTKARIFDPFFTTKFHGRGLGLAAVAGIIRNHKGAIEVESEPGAGSTLRVWLPAGAAPVPSANAETRPAAEECHGTGTVLVVDDESFVRDVAQRGLSRCGYEVLTAPSGTAAVETFRERADEVRAVVLDLSMPGMSGQETLARLRAVKPDLVAVISSGYSEAEALRIFGDAGIAGFVQKPYTPVALARKLKRIFDPAE
jgi:PAS domain S-box-containing protein